MTRLMLSLLSHVELCFLLLQKHHRRYCHLPRRRAPSSSFHANQTAFAFLCYGNAIWRPIVAMAVTKLQVNATCARSFRTNVITTASSTVNIPENAFRGSGSATRSSTAGWSELSTYSTRRTRRPARTVPKSAPSTSCRARTEHVSTYQSFATGTSTAPMTSSPALIDRCARAWNVITTARLHRTARSASAPLVKISSIPQNVSCNRSALKILSMKVTRVISSA